jgi:hypothetical protein
MQQYVCVGPTDPDYNDEQHIHDTWHEHYTDRADAFWVWQSFRLCRRTPRKVILSRAVTMALAPTWTQEPVFTLGPDLCQFSKHTSARIAMNGVRLVRRWPMNA